jgi:two-component system sensor histidine kinase/response regulator
VAANGRIAVDKLKAGGSYDLVLMDLQMPELDGFGATAAIRAMPALAGLPLVAMTAHAMPEERQRCLDAGMNDHLTKPIDPEVLFATLARWTEKKAAQIREPVPDSNGTFEGSMPDIEGIDVKGGLHRVGGNVGLYRKLLSSFASSQALVAQQIGDLLQAGDRAAAERAAHSTRGVAGNIGATALSELASRVEKAIRERHEDESLLQDLAKACDSAVAAVRAALPDDVVATTSDVAPASTETVSQLLQYLESGDVAAPDFFAGHRSGLLLVLGERGKSVERAIDDFDFDAALAAMRELLQKQA